MIMDIPFTGSSDYSSGTFIRTVRRLAIEKEKATDDAWMAALAASLFDGKALMWFETLDRSTQRDWDTLRVAFLKKYPPEMTSEIPSLKPFTNAMIPVPAAAPPRISASFDFGSDSAIEYVSDLSRSTTPDPSSLNHPPAAAPPLPSRSPVPRTSTSSRTDEFIALYNFKEKESGELTLSRGDRVELIERDDTGKL